MSNDKPVNRRDFVKRSSVAATAVTLFTALPSQEARAQQPIKIGVVGCGGRGRGAIRNALAADDNIKIVALADIFPEKMEMAKADIEKSGADTESIQTFLGFKSYQELVKTDCDYVMLTTPPCYRPESIEAAVNAGKHVFMEKPAAVDAPGIRRIIAAGEQAQKKGLSIVAGTQRRHQPAYHETIKRIQDGLIGDIVNAQTFWCGGPIGFPDRKPEWSEVEWQIRGWYHWLWLSGDHILEQHVHNIDVINWVLGGHPLKAYGSGGRSWQERGNIWDHHAVHFEYPNNVNVLSMASQYSRESQRVEERLQGTKGSSFSAQHGPWHLKDAKGKTKWEFKGEDNHELPYILEHAALIDSIRNNKKINEAKQVAESTMTAMMGRMAEYTGKELTWDEAIGSDEKYPVYYEFGDVKEMDVVPPGGTIYTGEEGWKPG